MKCWVDGKECNMGSENDSGLLYMSGFYCKTCHRFTNSKEILINILKKELGIKIKEKQPISNDDQDAIRRYASFIFLIFGFVRNVITTQTTFQDMPTTVNKLESNEKFLEAISGVTITFNNRATIAHEYALKFMHMGDFDKITKFIIEKLIIYLKNPARPAYDVRIDDFEEIEELFERLC